jgi:hypothetical protein
LTPRGLDSYKFQVQPAALTQPSSEATAFISPEPEEGGPAEPSIRLTPLWLLAQFAPSPQLAYGDGTARYGMRWQLTPLLYSFGIHRELSPWRVFVVEPVVRQSGSVELFVGPEFIWSGGGLAKGWFWRSGVRSYFPLVERGEYLSVSIGASYFDFAGRSGVAYEVGAYALYGIVGVQLTWAPGGGPAATIATLRLRYF